MKIQRKSIGHVNGYNFDNKAKTAKNSSTCVMCGKQAQLFSTKLAEFHNKVWGLCESCQEEYSKTFYQLKF